MLVGRQRPRSIAKRPVNLQVGRYKQSGAQRLNGCACRQLPKAPSKPNFSWKRCPANSGSTPGLALGYRISANETILLPPPQVLLNSTQFSSPTAAGLNQVTFNKPPVPALRVQRGSAYVN
jgi:hypothetical protein